MKNYAGVEGFADGAHMGNVFVPGKRRRMNVVAVCMNIFLPWFLFCAIYGMMSFTFHYLHPRLCWLLALAGFGLAIATAYLAYIVKKSDRDPMWYTFAAIAFFLATFLAVWFGDMNFWYNMEPYYDIENLNTYPSVNPARDKGQQLMDAGRIYFADGTRLDTTKAMALKNLDLYCVAPIVDGDEPLVSYDFWVVGVNCCSGVEAADFRCGEYYNQYARAGLRVMREDLSSYFRLAVQQAESAYHLQATHPLFFYWMQDPIDRMNSYRDNGFKHYLLGIFAHFAFNLFCVVCAVVGFSKIGRY